MIARTLALLLLTAGLSVGFERDGFAQPADAAAGGGDEAAIMAVIQGESAAFWDKDYERWAGYWAHGPYVRIMGWWADGGITVTEGWETISANMRKLMQDHPEPNPTAGLVRRENVNMRIVGDMAMVTFDQYGLDTGDARMDMPGLSRESRMLERQDGAWKFIYVGWLLQGGEDKQ
jgi:hypothetical protein